MPFFFCKSWSEPLQQELLIMYDIALAHIIRHKKHKKVECPILFYVTDLRRKTSFCAHFGEPFSPFTFRCFEKNGQLHMQYGPFFPMPTYEALVRISLCTHAIYNFHCCCLAVWPHFWSREKIKTIIQTKIIIHKGELWQKNMIFSTLYWNTFDYVFGFRLCIYDSLDWKSKDGADINRALVYFKRTPPRVYF